MNGSTTSPDACRVAFVDTPLLDRDILDELRTAGFHLHRLTGTNPIEGLPGAEAKVVVVDHDLPDGTGPALLQAAAAVTPAVKVVVLSSATTARAAVRLFRLGATDVVLKPVNGVELAQVLHRVTRSQEAAPSSTRPAARSAHGLRRPPWANPGLDAGPLPPLHPHLVNLHARADLESSVGSVIQVAESDPVLASRVLRTANSVWYRGPRPYTNIRDACVRLGNRQTLTIFLEAAYQESFRPAHPALQGIVERFRKVTILSARVSRFLGASQQIARLEELYAATLLHNFGELILLWRFGSTLLPGEDLGGDRIDEAAFFIDQLHEEAGAAFARAHRMPPLVALLAHNHHTARPREIDYDHQLRLVTLAAWATARRAVGAYLPTRHPADPALFLTELAVPDAVRDELDKLVTDALADEASG